MAKIGFVEIDKYRLNVRCSKCGKSITQVPYREAVISNVRFAEMKKDFIEHHRNCTRQEK